MISDWSGVALEYAFVFYKPVVFCDIPKKINNPNYMDLKLEPIEVSLRHKIGVIWDCKSPINNAIELSFFLKENELKKIRNQYCFNIGYSDYQFVQKLKKIYAIIKKL